MISGKIMKHSNISNTSTIKWMRNKVKPEVISSSLTSLLLEKEKKIPLILQILNGTQFLNSLTKDNASNKSNMNPQMFFNETTLKKIHQIRDLFIDFDEDRSRTLDVSELHKMFNSNQIPLTKRELVKLFGKGIKNKIEDYRLSFFDIVLFSLSEKHNYNFRNLMKKVKKRVDKDIYIPLDFNTALEYIYNKGLIKKSLKKIERGIKTLNRLEKQFTSQSNEKCNTIMNKLGIGRSINLNQVFKGFRDVIDISRSLMHKVNSQHLKYKKEFENVTQCRSKFKDDDSHSSIKHLSSVSKKTRNILRCDDLPIIDSKPNTKRTIMHKKVYCISNNIKYIRTTVSSFIGKNTYITDTVNNSLFSLQNKTARH